MLIAGYGDGTIATGFRQFAVLNRLVAAYGNTTVAGLLDLAVGNHHMAGYADCAGGAGLGQLATGDRLVAAYGNVFLGSLRNRTVFGDLLVAGYGDCASGAGLGQDAVRDRLVAAYGDVTLGILCNHAVSDLLIAGYGDGTIATGFRQFAVLNRLVATYVDAAIGIDIKGTAAGNGEVAAFGCRLEDRYRTVCVNVHKAASGYGKLAGSNVACHIHGQGRLLVFQRLLNRNGLQSHIACAYRAFSNIGHNGCGTAIFHDQVLVGSGNAAVSGLQFPDHAINNDVAVQAGIALIDVNVGILCDYLFSVLVQEYDLLRLNVQRLALGADGTGAAGCDDGCLSAGDHIGGMGIRFAVEEGTLRIVHTDFHILTCGDVHDLVIRSVLRSFDLLRCGCAQHGDRTIGTGHNIRRVAILVEGRELNVGDIAGAAAAAHKVGVGLLVNPNLNVFLSVGVIILHRNDAVGNADVLLFDCRPVGLTVHRIVECAVVSPVAGAADLVDVMSNVIRQTLQHNLLSTEDFDDRPVLILHGRNLIQDLQRLRFGHGMSVFLTIEDIVDRQNIDMIVLVNIDRLAVFVNTRQVLLHCQLTEFGSNQLCGGVNTAIKLGSKVFADVDDQTALGQIHRTRDMVSVVLRLYHIIFRQTDGLQADIFNRTGEDDGIARTAETQNRYQSGGAVYAVIDEALFGFRIVLVRLAVRCKRRVMRCTNQFLPDLLFSRVRIIFVSRKLPAFCINQLPGVILVNDVVLLTQGAVQIIELHPRVCLLLIKGCLLHQKLLIVVDQRDGFLFGFRGIMLIIQEQLAGQNPVDGDIFVKDENIISAVVLPPLFVFIQCVSIKICRVGDLIVEGLTFPAEPLEALGQGRDHLDIHHYRLQSRYVTTIEFRTTILIFVLGGSILRVLDYFFTITCDKNQVSISIFLLLVFHAGNMNRCLGRVCLVVTIAVCILPIAFLITCDGLGIRLVFFLNDGNAGAIHCSVQHILYIHRLARKHVTTSVHGLLLERVRLVLDTAVLIQHAKLIVLNTEDFLVGRLVCKASKAYIVIIKLEFGSVQQKQTIAQINLVENILLAQNDRLSIAVQAVNVDGIAVFVLRFVEGQAILGCILHAAEFAFIGDGSGDFGECVGLDGKGLLDRLEGSVGPRIVRPPGNVPHLGDAVSIVGKVGFQPHSFVPDIDAVLGLCRVSLFPENIIQLRILRVDNCLTERRILHINLFAIDIVGVVTATTLNLYSITGSQEVCERKVIPVCQDSDFVQQLVCGKQSVTLGTIVPIIAIVGLKLTILIHQVLELLPVCHLLGRNTLHRVHRVELDVAVVRVGFALNQVVGNALSLGIDNIGEAGIQAVHIVVILCTDLCREFQRGLPLYQLSVNLLGQSNCHAIEQANSFQPFLCDRLSQNLEGSILFNRQLSGLQIDGNAAAELDLNHIIVIVIDELVVAHVRYDIILPIFLHNPGNVAVLVRIDKGPVRQLIEVQVLCRIVGDQIPLQHVQTGEHVRIGQHDLVAFTHNIIQSAGDGDGNGGCAGHPVDVFALLQCQIDIALAGMNTAQINVDIFAGSDWILGKRINPANRHTGDIHIDIAAGSHIHRTGRGVGEHPGAECHVFTAHTGSSAYNQSMHPQGADLACYRRDFFFSRQSAARLPCPNDIGSAIVDRDQAGEVYTACTGAGHIELR